MALARLKEKINGKGQSILNVVSIVLSIIVAMLIIFGNPLQAASRSELKAALAHSDSEMNQRLDRMELRLNKRIDEVKEEVRERHNGGRK